MLQARGDETPIALSRPRPRTQPAVQPAASLSTNRRALARRSPPSPCPTTRCGPDISGPIAVSKPTTTLRSHRCPPTQDYKKTKRSPRSMGSHRFGVTPTNGIRRLAAVSMKLAFVNLPFRCSWSRPPKQHTEPTSARATRARPLRDAAKHGYCHQGLSKESPFGRQ